MLDHKHRRPYWIETRRLMLIVVVSLVLSVFMVLLFLGLLDSYRFLGYPVGYFLLANGFVIVGFIGFAWHGYAQDNIDHRHGTNEDH